MKILMLLTFLASTLAVAQDANYGMKNPEFAYVYQQNRFQKEDVLGDILLAHSVRNVPAGLFNIIIGRRGEYYTKPYMRAYEIAKEYPELSRINGDDAVYVKELPVPKTFYKLDEKSLIKQFKNSLGYQTIRRGSIPTWSKEFTDKYKSKIIPGLGGSKLLMCLVRGACSRFLVTGHEKELEDWAMTQKDLSITPPALLSRALELTNNNLSLALLTCQNTLSWHSKAQRRHLTQLQTKLMPFITLKNHKSEDKFGEWYHMFGIITYAFTKGETKASMISFVESAGGRVMGSREVVEEEVNSISSKIGQSLKKLFDKK
jgi:hypothetical protein